MTNTLLDCVRRFADAHSDEFGIARTPIPGLSTIRADRPSTLQYAISRPLVVLVLQGGKRVTMGKQSFDFGAGDSLLIAADVPTASQITRASMRVPYYSLALDLDPATIKSISLEMDIVGDNGDDSIRVDPTDAHLADAALRLMNLIDRPRSLPLLQAQHVREMHYWLLAGRHGAAIRAVGVSDSRVHRIGRAVAIIRNDYAKSLRIEQLAEAASMSRSSFHQHFLMVTSLSPLQFQKRLRLIEARRMMLSDGTPVRNAAYAVGYESVPQFTREYRRLFGKPPARDVNDARARVKQKQK